MESKDPLQNFSARWKHRPPSEVFPNASAPLLSALSQELQKKNDPRLFQWLPLLRDLGQERDRDFFCEGLLYLGDQFRDEGHLDLAASAYSSVPSLGGKDLARRAEERLQVLAGKGPFGLRCEFLAPRLAKESLNLSLIAPMLGTSLLGRTVGTAIFGRLTGAVHQAWWTRGIGAEILAGLGSYAIELPLFVGMSRMLARHPEDPSNDWEHAALLLGMMKLVNAAGSHPTARALNRVPTLLRSQGGIFLSLLATRQLEQHLELRPYLESAGGWGDLLVEAIGIGFGSHLGSQLLGPAFARLALGLKMRASSSAQPPPFFKIPDSGSGGALVVEGLPALRSKSSPARLGENFFMVESGGSERGARGGTRPVTVEEKRVAYRNFAETAPVNLETWLGRLLKKNRAPVGEIEETMAILWGDSPPMEKGLAEMDWIETHRFESAIPRLRSYLQYSNRDHRIRALQVLTTLKEPKPLPELVELLFPYLDNRVGLNESQIFEVETILHAMTVLGVPDELMRDLGQPYIRLLRGHRNREVSTAAEAASLQLGLITQIPDYRPMLTSALQPLRLSALSILKTANHISGVTTYRPQVVERLSDPDPQVRILAAETLAKQGRKKEIILLGKLLREDSNAKVQRAAANLLEELGSPAAYEDLLVVLNSPSSPSSVHEGALNALGKLGARAALDLLKFFSFDTKPQVRFAAAIALTHCGEIDLAVPIFREAFAAVHHLSWHMQILQGIAGLSRENGRALLKKLAEEPVHPLLAIVGDPNPKMAAPAAQALDSFQEGWDENLLRLWELVK